LSHTPSLGIPCGCGLLASPLGEAPSSLYPVPKHLVLCPRRSLASCVSNLKSSLRRWHILVILDPSSRPGNFQQHPYLNGERREPLRLCLSIPFCYGKHQDANPGFFLPESQAGSGALVCEHWPLVSHPSFLVPTLGRSRALLGPEPVTLNPTLPPSGRTLFG
jgi:hypothetical protein